MLTNYFQADGTLGADYCNSYHYGTEKGISNSVFVDITERVQMTEMMEMYFS